MADLEAVVKEGDRRNILLSSGPFASITKGEMDNSLWALSALYSDSGGYEQYKRWLGDYTERIGDSKIKSNNGLDIRDYIIDDPEYWSKIDATIADFGPENSKTAFVPGFKSSFIQSCLGGPGQTSTSCTCRADYLINNYTESQLTHLSEKIESGDKNPQELREAAVSCTTEKDYDVTFMNSCNTTGNIDEECSCVLTYIKGNSTLRERVEMDFDLVSTNQMPKLVTDAMSSCGLGS